MTALALESKERAFGALNGTRIGDAFGQAFFVDADQFNRLVSNRELPAERPLHYTDDTAMSLVTYEHLCRFGEIDQDAFARELALEYQSDPMRAYGPSVQSLLRDIAGEGDWRMLSQNMFEGQGSYGNGAAMRSAVIGAWFAHDADLAVAQAALGAEVTHNHPDGIAGAKAVAAAAVWMSRSRTAEPIGSSLLAFAAEAAGDTDTGSRLRIADGKPEMSLRLAVDVLGNGTDLSSRDTVPLALWIANQLSDTLMAGWWRLVEAKGDRDTTCAIFGGVVGISGGTSRLPADLLDAVEAFPKGRPNH